MSVSVEEVDIGQYNSGSTRSWTVAAAQVGDYILVLIADEAGVGVTSVADNKGNSYSQLQGYDDDLGCSAHYCVVGTTASTVVTVTYVGSTINFYSCLLVRGAAAIDDSAKATGSAVDDIKVTLTTTQSDVLLAGVYVGGRDPAAQNGFTTLHDSAYNIFSLAEYDLTNTAGTNDVGVTYEFQAAARFVGVAIRGPAAGGKPWYAYAQQ